MSEKIIVSVIAGEKIYSGDCVEIVDGKAKRSNLEKASHIAFDRAEEGEKIDLVVCGDDYDICYDFEEGEWLTKLK